MKNFAAAGGLALTLAVGMTTVVDAQERVRWRVHSAYAQAMPIAGPTAWNIAEDVETLTDGNFDIRVFEPGAIVAGTQYYDAVSEGASGEQGACRRQGGSRDHQPPQGGGGEGCSGEACRGQGCRGEDMGDPHRYRTPCSSTSRRRPWALRRLAA